MAQHKWHKEIKAWADGEEIEVRCQLINGWTSWMPVEITNPQWFDDNEYRIKPQPKKPQYLYAYLRLQSSSIEWCVKGGDVEGYDYIGKIKLEDIE